MDNSSLSAVISLDDKRETQTAIIELDSAKRVIGISSLSWELIVQQVLRVAGLSVNEHLLGDSVTPVSGSPAAVLGHNSLRSLVESSSANHGLEQDWDEFRAKVNALVYRQKLSISETDYKEINAQVEDATQILGRAPIDSAEFHGAKQKVLSERLDELQAEKGRLQGDFDRRLQALQQDISRKTTEANQAHADMRRVEEDAAKNIQAMRRETALIQEQTETEARSRVATAQRQGELDAQRQLSALRDSLQSQISQAEEKKQVAEGELADLSAKIRSGEYVSKSAFDDALANVSSLRLSEVNMRNELLAINQQLTDERLISAGLREDLLKSAEARDQDRNHIKTLESRLSSIIEDRIKSSEFAVLHERIRIHQDTNAELNSKLEAQKQNAKKMESSLNDVRGRYKQLRTNGRQYCDALKSRIVTLEGNEANLMRNLVQVKISLAVAMTCGAGATIAFGLKHLGLI